MPKPVQWAIVPEFSGRAIFCEDIRREATGQLTIVGCLPETIHVDQFPTTLNKLCVLVDIQLSGDSEDLPVTFKGFLPGSTAETPYTETLFDFANAMKGSPMPEPVQIGPYPAYPVKRVQQVLTSVGLQINEPGPIQLRAFRNGVVYAIGALMVAAVPEADQASQPS
jgi:hypothetical protein